MKAHYLGQFAASASAGTKTTAYSICANENDNNNKNNIGVFSVSGNTATGTFTVQGSVTGTDANAYEWVDLATGITVGVGSSTVGGSGAKTIALMPYMRAVVTTAPGAIVNCYISQ